MIAQSGIIYDSQWSGSHKELKLSYGFHLSILEKCIHIIIKNLIKRY